MFFPLPPRRGRLTALALIALASAACDEGTPLALDGQPLVVTGQVLSVTSDAGPAAASSSSDAGSLGGIEVSVEGSAATTITDAQGGFRLEVEGELDRLVIRFRRGGLDARIELEGLSPGATLHLEVRLSDDGGTVRRDDGLGAEVQGQVRLVELRGTAPNRTLRVELSASGSVTLLEIDESSVRFESDGDVLGFEALLSALARSDLSVRLEGDAVLLEDGTVLATSIKVETDEHAADDGQPDDDRGGDDDGAAGVEFEGAATLLGVTDDGSSRIVRLQVTGDGSWEVWFAEGVTSFDAGGDIRTVAALALAMAGTADVRVEGRGTRQEDGSVLALTARAEIDD